MCSIKRGKCAFDLHKRRKLELNAMFMELQLFQDIHFALLKRNNVPLIFMESTSF